MIKLPDDMVDDKLTIEEVIFLYNAMADIYANEGCTPFCDLSDFEIERLMKIKKVMNKLDIGRKK